MYSKTQLTENIQLNLIRSIEHIQDNTRDAKCLLRVLKNDQLINNPDYHRSLMKDALQLQFPKEHKIACFFNNIFCNDRDTNRNDSIISKVKNFIVSTLNIFKLKSDETSFSTFVVSNKIKKIIAENDKIILHKYMQEQFREFVIILEKSTNGYQLCSYNLRHNIISKGFHIEEESKKIIRDNLTENNIVIMLNNLNDALKHL